MAESAPDGVFLPAHDMNAKNLFVALVLVTSAILFYMWGLDVDSHQGGAGAAVANSPALGKTIASELAGFDTLDDEKKISFLDEQKAKATPPALADLAMRAMESSNQDVRRAALISVNQLQSSELLPVVRKALADSSAEMRLLALHEARMKTPVLRLNLLETAIKSEFADTRDGALIELSRENPKAAVPIMMEGLNSADADFRERVWQEIAPNIQELRKSPFPNTTEALVWWNQVKDRFDPNMVLLDPSVIPSEN